MLIAKALSHEPAVLFLDEPTAGVDVELRRDMWRVVRQLRDAGTTIILTTHYLEEAEEMADRIGVINRGELMLVEEKTTLMRRLGGKRLTIELAEHVAAVPDMLAPHGFEISADGRKLVHSYDASGEGSAIAPILAALAGTGLAVKDLGTEESTLEEIFVGLVGGKS